MQWRSLSHEDLILAAWYETESFMGSKTCYLGLEMRMVVQVLGV